MLIVKKYLQEAFSNDSLLDRAYLFLEDGERDSAKEYFERVLDQNPRSTFAYLGKLIIALKMEDIGDLATFETSYTEHPDFVKALRFSEGELHDELKKLSSERDATQTAYEKAVETEKSAQTIDELKTAYSLYCQTRNFADAEDRLSAIEDAISVISHYAERGAKNLRGYIDMLSKQKQTLNENINSLNTGVSMAKNLIAQNNMSIARLNAERSSLGFFKGKRKKQIDLEVAILKQNIEKTEKDVNEFQKKIKACVAEKEKCEAGLSLESLLASASFTNDTTDGELQLRTFDNDKEPLRILKQANVLSVVAKNPMALHELLHNDNAMKVILSTKKHIAAVGEAPAFKSVAVLCGARLQQFPQLLPYLPLKERLKAELQNGNEITLGLFPKNGKDPYADLILPPGVPYTREGNPVKWTVLQKDKNYVTLICNSALVTKRYEKTSQLDTTWNNCELRAYMQGEMFNLLFQGEERDLIVSMTGSMGGQSYTDKITLPTFAEIKKVLDKLPNEGFAWTSDKIEISKEINGSSVLTQPSVASLKHKGEAWKQLVHVYCYVVPKITIKL